jgi:hypothetical protein
MRFAWSRVGAAAKKAGTQELIRCERTLDELALRKLSLAAAPASRHDVEAMTVNSNTHAASRASTSVSTAWCCSAQRATALPARSVPNPGKREREHHEEDDELNVSHAARAL